MLSKLLRILLLPFSLLYFIGVQVRNYLFDIGFLKSTRFDVKTIGVGNLRVGGTGKTPHVEYLIELLSAKYQIATLSRGYGRSTKGFLLANPNSSATNLGDEPMQFYSKYGNQVVVAVGEDRVMAIPQILYDDENVNLVLLDDVYQHRAVSPHINILLSEYSRPFYSDVVMPAGRLRESRKGATRADLVIVSKCPDQLDSAQMAVIEEKIRAYSGNQTNVFYTGLKYKTPKALYDLNEDLKPQSKVILVSGIANADGLERAVKSKYELIRHFNFSDHFNYTEKSIESILKQFHETKGNDKAILLTEKDMVKWRNPEFKRLLSGISVFYLPVEIYFLRDKAKFDELIFSRLGEE